MFLLISLRDSGRPSLELIIGSSPFLAKRLLVWQEKTGHSLFEVVLALKLYSLNFRDFLDPGTGMARDTLSRRLFADSGPKGPGRLLYRARKKGSFGKGVLLESPFPRDSWDVRAPQTVENKGESVHFWQKYPNPFSLGKLETKN